LCDARATSQPPAECLLRPCSGNIAEKNVINGLGHSF